MIFRYECRITDSVHADAMLSELFQRYVALILASLANINTRFFVRLLLDPWPRCRKLRLD
jgi:hypothetical protein